MYDDDDALSINSGKKDHGPILNNDDRLECESTKYYLRITSSFLL